MPHFRETECDPYPKRGVVAFRDFVLEHQGGGDLGITRPCSVKGVGVSGHWAGRAWDWAMNADDPADVARVEELLEWLLEDDAERFRRLGLKYLIWDRQRWSALGQKWEPYKGPHPHRDHVHFSFGPEGAAGETSFFRWLFGEEPPGIEPPPPGIPWQPPRPAASAGIFVVGAALGFGLTFAAARWRPKRKRW